MIAADALTAAYPSARRLAIGIAGGLADGEDLVQDAMCRLWGLRDRYSADVLPRMLYRTMLNIQHDRHRRGRVIRWVPLPDGWDVLVDAGSPEAITVADDEARRVRAVVEALSATDRDVLVCVYWEGVSQTGSGPGFKARVQRARTRFRVAWEAA